MARTWAGLIASACVMTGLQTGPASAKSTMQHFGDFKVRLTYDSFTGKTACTLEGASVRYRDGILSFPFDPNIPTDRALVRIDYGPVIRAADYSRQIRSQQLFSTSGPLDNPDKSRVLLPASLFENARFVDIRPNPDKRFSRHFKLKGLSAALTFMQTHNCRPGIDG